MQVFLQVVREIQKFMLYMIKTDIWRKTDQNKYTGMQIFIDFPA